MDLTFYEEEGIVPKVYGPYVSKSHERKYVILKYYRGKIKNKLYSRFLFETHTQKILSSNEMVDHIDGDKKNDVIENLQILSRSENAKKQYKQGQTISPNFGKKKVLDIKCCICFNDFQIDEHDYKRIEINKSHRLTCSSKCGAKLGWTVRESKKSE